MDLNQVNLPLNVWLVQTLAGTFLMTGFVSFEIYLWHRTVASNPHQAQLYRFFQLVMPLVIAVGFTKVYDSYFGFMESTMLANVAVAMIALPLFNNRINWLIDGLQALAVVLIWWLLHVSQASLPEDLPLLGVLVATLVVINVFRVKIRESPQGMIWLSLCFTASFWVTLINGHLAVDWQAAIMYLVMSTFIAVHWIRSQQQFQLDQRVQALTQYDDLMNQAAYERSRKESNQLFKKAQAQHIPLIVVALDVDYFKQFNQTYGHMTGNATLIAITQRLKQVLTEAKLLYHLYHTGGEEFSVIFPQATLDQITAVISRCLAKIRLEPFPVDGGQVAVTLSAGITVMRPTDQTVDAVFKRADDNLYLSKRRGRNVVTTKGVTAESDHDVDLKQLAYFAQPIEAVTTQGTDHWAAELLLRRYDEVHQHWQLPARFDLAVDKQIALMTQALPAMNVQQLTLNLTLAQFNDSNTARSLAAFVKSGNGPAQLIVEITDVPTLATLRRVSALYRDAGIAIYIDDVGSDNSFELVRKLLPYVNGVKFAMQNLRSYESEARIRERILFWLGIARENHIDFILEGVENQTDLFYAKSLGIEHFQGYYFDKPRLPMAQS